MYLPFVTNKETVSAPPPFYILDNPNPSHQRNHYSRRLQYNKYLSRIPNEHTRHGLRVSIAQDVQTLRNHAPQYPEHTHTPNLQDRSSDIHSQRLTSQARPAGLELAAVARMARRRIRMLGRELRSWCICMRWEVRGEQQGRRRNPQKSSVEG
jgi:hypothetical protein